MAEEQILREKFPSLFQGFQGFATVFRAAILQTWPPQIIASSSAPPVCKSVGTPTKVILVR